MENNKQSPERPRAKKGSQGGEGERAGRKQAAAAKTGAGRRGPAAMREIQAERELARRERAAARGEAPDTKDAARPQQRRPAPRRERAEHVEFDDVIAGHLDVEDDAQEAGQETAPRAAPAQPHKRVLNPDAEQPKLHKVLAQAGIGSRLEMERLIQEGRVLVNNAPAHVGQRVQMGDQIKVNGKPIRLRIAPPPVRVLAYHKPAGEVVTRDDPQSRPTVFRKLPPLHQGKWQAVGRLDLNTEGLLLFTNSGDLANRLMHPRFGLEREYAVRVLGALTEEEKQRLLEGVRLEDGDAAFSSIQDGGGEGVNQWYKVTISEGRNREVRRMMEAVGHAVSRLIRIRYGSVALVRGLHRGMYLDLSDRDVQRLMQEAGMEPQAASSSNRAGAGKASARTSGRAAPDRAQGRAPGRTANRAPAPAPQPRQATGRPGRGRGVPADGYIGQDSIEQYRQKNRLKKKRQNRR